ncbi:pyridoxamine 5'-phosphate oxidase [Legionella impletisoli]|uniref:Pyridoxine/pyridoxamine 5'-phosphate oxidase n=1 Tax=Legionella impletisoli TaxID=343510 RepID=A0A917JYX2_9GAMM|nr:pyridoxamine 5'-phosphate oxidase [Legionella impletisoli]GGI88906.1 pyridoxine/pyridoxamine 5'-phosphate oxidase [Legionella impletisoli]
MKKGKTIAEIRREYGNLSLSKQSAALTPFEQFERWFQEVVETEISDPTAMVLATADEHAHPDTRVVLLKGIENNAFLFFTNYRSTKAIQIEHNPHVSLNFFWPEMSRQVRIRGTVQRASKKLSDVYFSSRPLHSQYSAISSPQSQVIKDRSELEQRFNELVAKHQQAPVMRPEYWGGYLVSPETVEFWQGRDSRLHDRIRYFLKNDHWHKERLAP